MPPKAKMAAPIDRPLSRAYVREFGGWATADPPGISDPTTMRIMENILINRDGSAGIRPGMRYLSYSRAPGVDTIVEELPPAADSTTITSVANRKVTGSGDNSFTTINWPPNTKEGDLVVLTFIGSYSRPATCTDPRLKRYSQKTMRSRNCEIWIGYATNVLVPIKISMQTNSSSAVGQFCMASAHTFRMPEGRRLYADLDNLVVSPIQTSTTAELPRTSGENLSGGAMIYMTCVGDGWIGGVYGEQDWAKSTGWTARSITDNSYVESSVSTFSGTTFPTAVTPNTDTDNDWFALAVGLRDTEDPGLPGAKLVGSQNIFNPGPTDPPITTVAYPAGTLEGDLVTLALMGGYGAPVACDDPRMTLVHSDTLGSRPVGLWRGYASDLATPLSMHLVNDGGVDAHGQFAFGLLHVYRDGAGGTLSLVPGAPVVSDTSTSTTDLMPAAPPGGNQSLMTFFYDSVAGSSYGDQDWSKALEWDVVNDWSGNNHRTYLGVDTVIGTPETGQQTTANTDEGDTRWMTVAHSIESTSLVPPTPALGQAAEMALVGTQEPFYLSDGTKAYLQAVREEDGTVGFRVLVIDVNDSTMYDLTHPMVDFDVQQSTAVLNFSADTTYVTYLQVDNKVFALSDNGEPMRVFYVGAEKVAKALAEITRPEWDTGDKLSVVHPVADWINGGDPIGKRRNLMPNPSFEKNFKGWSTWKRTFASRVTEPSIAIVSGNRTLKLGSKPERTNLVRSPLHDVGTTGVTGWDGPVTPVDDYMQVDMASKGEHFAHSRVLEGIEPRESYRLAMDTLAGGHVTMKARVRFIGVNGVRIGPDVEFTITEPGSRWISKAFAAPKSAVSARVYIGGENTAKTATSVSARNVLLAQADEGGAMLHGGSGVDYFWTGAANDSASVFHPATDIALVSDKISIPAAKALCLSLYVTAGQVGRTVTLTMRTFNKHGEQVGSEQIATAPDVTTGTTRLEVSTPSTPKYATHADLKLVISDVPRDEHHFVDAVLVEPKVETAGAYFDGSTANVPTKKVRWTGKPHESVSREVEYSAARGVPAAAARTTDTLQATGGRANNPYSFAFFYTFNNEVGESAASMMSFKRAARPITAWSWETPNAASEPSGTSTSDPLLAADQFVASIPEEVYDEAVSMGATSWSLYMMTWSDQDATPVMAAKIGEKELPVDGEYGHDGWIQVTPASSSSTDIAAVPTEENRYNYSKPSSAGQGLVASDRMVLVNDPNDAAVIRWSSNKQGEYTNFTASKGGGYKTLTSGNLFVPAAVKLWQNPQSADTICILCLGTDGHSTSYYMAPAQVAQQSEAVNIMGFEETTATPGTTSPYGVEIFNNALYHPLDEQLMKSTASNYNISHKSQTDQISDVWEKLATKYWIMSGVHDSRLYYLVNNLDGAPLEEGCKGNELWVFDAAAKTGTWSRLLIQGHALRKLEFGGQIYMSVTRPDGIYYLDPEYAQDDWVDEDLTVRARNIAWKLETNTQGANRAHDAWAHLQQANVIFGNLEGRCRWGLRSVDINGKDVEVEKITKGITSYDGLAYDIEDPLLIRRDLREWYFFASSIEDENGEPEYCKGQINLVQYRYTPSTVNTGYENGSVETFQYGRDVAQVPSTTSNGVPVPLTDVRRP